MFHSSNPSSIKVGVPKYGLGSSRPYEKYEIRTNLGDWEVDLAQVHLDLVDSASLSTRCLDHWLASIINIALKLHSEESKYTSAFASVYFTLRVTHAPLVHFHWTWTWTWAESVEGHLVLKSPSSRPSPPRLSPPWTWPWPGGLEWSLPSPHYPNNSGTYNIVQYKNYLPLSSFS